MKHCIIIALASLLYVGCNNYEDLEFTGIVVDYQECTGITDLGYAIKLSAPDTIGGEYMTRDTVLYNNVVVVFGADRFLHKGDNVSGRIYLDPNYSKTECYYHYNQNVPEARFTKLKVIK